MKGWTSRVLPSVRICVLFVIYTVIIAASFYLAYEVRFDFLVPPEHQRGRLVYWGFDVAVKLLALVAARQFSVVLRYFSMPGLMRMYWAMAWASGFLIILRVLDLQWFHPPRSVLIVDFMFCFGGLCAARVAIRLYRERYYPDRKAEGQQKQRIAIVGAGDVGATVANEFLNAPSRGFLPVAFFDDDRRKHGKAVHGVPVLGRPEALRDMKDRDKLAKLVIAMPSAPAKRVREVVNLALELNLKVETVPSYEQVASGRVKTSRIRQVEVQDLLGRPAVNLDSESIRKFIEGSVVMVTGAGGSIGSELCRQLAGLNPTRLLMVDKSEGSLFLIEQELNETGRGSQAVPLVADILDGERMASIFNRYRPEVVFHAAAHKHVFMMERQPAEAIRNNVLGTRLVARLAAAMGVRAFVLISTDKAINPTSVMGATKRLAEIQLLAIQDEQEGECTDFMAVRFGNVLGSSGSVIPIFKRQIENGGPVTVTHPEVTRYFMTIPEAVGLVLQSAVMGKGGEIFVLDMGQPVKIAELAKQMIVLSGLRPGEDIEIRFTGLKPGEKLYEELRHRSEQYEPTNHPHVMRFVGRTELDEVALQKLEEELHELESADVKKALQKLVLEYTPYLD